MAWTSPRTWTVGEIVTASIMNTHVRDQLSYLKGSAGAITLDDRVNIPLTSGTNGKGLRLGDATNQYGNFQGLDLGSVSYLFFATNRQYDGSAWQQLNARVGGCLQISGDALTYNTFAAASATPVERFQINASGNVGIGTAAPQGRIHGYDTIAGFMHYKFDGVDGALRTIIPDGTGDVLYGLAGHYVVRPSTGTAVAGAFSMIGTPANFSPYSVGGDALTIHLAANGSVDVQRTAGTLTYKVSLWFTWL